MSWNRILGWHVRAGREQQERTCVQWARDRIRYVCRGRVCIGWDRIGGRVCMGWGRIGGWVCMRWDRIVGGHAWVG